MQKKSGKVSPSRKLHSAEKKESIEAPGSPDMFENEDVGSQAQTDQPNDVDEISSPKESQAEGVSPSPSSTLDQMEYMSSSEEDFDANETDDKKVKSLHPMCSFQIIRGLMMNVYYINYPFDICSDIIKASKKAENRMLFPDEDAEFE